MTRRARRRGAVLGLGLAGALACLQFEVSVEDVARVAAPDGHAEAVVREINGGATTSLGYTVHVVPPGVAPSDTDRVASFDAAVRSDSAWGVSVRWSGPDTVHVEYVRARDAQLLRSVLSVTDRTVHVVLDSGVADPTAPGGGMLWNLRGRPPVTGAELADTLSGALMR